MARKTHQVDITILNSGQHPSGGPPSGKVASRAWLRRVARSGIQVALSSWDGPEGQPIQMGLVIADDDTLRRLNREYRGADEVTDVLSFAWDHEGHWEGDEEPAVNEAAAESGADVPWPADAMPTQDYYPLGEVIVSYPQAERQAQARGADTEQEMSLLIVHGILHLAGFDHVEPEEGAEMKAREQEALDRIWKK